MKHKTLKSYKLSPAIYAILLLLLVSGIFPSSAAAEPVKYSLIQPIPGVQEVETFPEYLHYLFPFALGLAALIAVLQIVWGGFRYASSFGDEQTMKDNKDRIEKAIWGLVLALIGYLMLYIINPDLVTLRFFPERVFLPGEPTTLEQLSKRSREQCLAGCPSSSHVCVASENAPGSWTCISHEELSGSRFRTESACVASCIVPGGGCIPIQGEFMCFVVTES